MRSAQKGTRAISAWAPETGQDALGVNFPGRSNVGKTQGFCDVTGRPAWAKDGGRVKNGWRVCCVCGGRWGDPRREKLGSGVRDEGRRLGTHEFEK